ncbi:hypothetical protein MKX01_013683 [Papaver californicum]|nr:hypothetical protein MKX01_013683 [Papaver californicum]
MTDLSKTASKHFPSSIERKSSTHSYKSFRATKLLEMDEVRSEDLNLHNCDSTAAASGQATGYSRGAYSCGGTSSIFAAVSALSQTWITKLVGFLIENIIGNLTTNKYDTSTYHRVHMWTCVQFLCRIK